MRQIEFVCKSCKKSFVRKKAYKNRTPKFCSSRCFGESIKNKRYCEECGGHLKWCNKRFCSRDCSSKNRTGKKLSESHRESLSMAKKGKRPQHFIEQAQEISRKLSMALIGKPQPWNRGKNHPNYVDGGKAAHARQKDMGRVEYKNWHRAVLKRDDYTCQICNGRGGKLCVDHIKSYAYYPKLRYELDNGRTLCVECHLNTDNYGGRVHKLEKSNEC